MGALSKYEDNASPVPLPGSQPDAFDGERTKIEKTNHQSQGNRARRATRPSGRRIGKATEPSIFTTLPQPVQALTVVYEIYSLAQAPSGCELYNAPCCRIIEDGLRKLLNDSPWTLFQRSLKFNNVDLFLLSLH